MTETPIPSSPERPLRGYFKAGARFVLHAGLFVVFSVFLYPAIKERYFPTDWQRLLQLVISTPFENCELTLQVRPYGQIRLHAYREGVGRITGDLVVYSMTELDSDAPRFVFRSSNPEPERTESRILVYADGKLKRIERMTFRVCNAPGDSRQAGSDSAGQCLAPTRELVCDAMSAERVRNPMRRAQF